jgi:hypothetical protein
MGLLNESGAAQAPKPQSGTPAAAPEKATDTTVGKKSNAYEYQKKLKAKQREGAQRILANRAYNLDATDKAFLEWLNKEPGSREGGGGNFGTPIFNKLFGDKPAIGGKVTLQEVFDKTYKGKAQMDSLMKKWKEKSNVEIEFVFNKEKPALSTYTIKSLG